jgi:hypothetical protein
MLRSNLAALAVLALIAAPTAAQETPYQWSDDRPDARAPQALLGGRMLDMGEFEVGYRLHKMNFGDVRLGTDILDFLDVLAFYGGAPFGRTETAHVVTVSWGFLDWLTFEGSAAWLSRDREFGTETLFVDTESSGISDVEAAALIQLLDRDGVKAHLIGGVEVPTGSIDNAGPDLNGTERILPYEMQLGTGSLSVVPGASAVIQNEHATLGAQLKARFRLNDNDRDYRYGDRFDGAIWVGYRLGDYFAVTSGARFSKWGSIKGEDGAMDPAQDPGQDPYFSSGTRLDIPLGLNVRLDEGLLAGTDVAFEFLWPTYENYEAPRQQGEWGFNLSVSRGLRLFGGEG